jgi:exopolyphosphatase/guanosine-5'-triphosphate,3'-diphosphate pyrophosphatase
MRKPVLRGCVRVAGDEVTDVSDANTQSNVVQTIAAFDIGSNSIKMTVARNGADSGIEEFLWRSETVRLGRDIGTSGVLADDRIDAALDTLRRFSTEARDAGAERLIGVATEATRVASNGKQFLQQVHDQTGIEIKAISGDREAELTFLGLDGIVDLSGPVAVADIGGGSTELILAEDRTVQWSQSIALGSGRMTERFVTHDPPTSDEAANIRAEAGRMVSEAPLKRATGGRLIVVGGTGEYLDRLIPAGAPRRPETLDLVVERLEQIPAAELSAMIDIPEARALVLPAGVAIAAAISDQMRPASFEAAQSGIRRGLLIGAFAGDL